MNKLQKHYKKTAIHKGSSTIRSKLSETSKIVKPVETESKPLMVWDWQVRKEGGWLPMSTVLLGGWLKYSKIG